MTSTALVETSSTFPAAPDRSRLLDAFFASRNERTLATYRADLGDSLSGNPPPCTPCTWLGLMRLPRSS